MSTTRRRWTPETIRAELEPAALELGRMPKRSELTERGLGGLWAAMSRNGGLDAWRAEVAERLSEAPVPREHIEIAAFFLSQNGHPGTPEDHWREAERALTR